MARKRPARVQADAAVDWLALPAEVIQSVADLLSRPDLKRASETCKSWRDALLALLLKEVRICPAELLDGSSGRRTRTGAWLDLQGLLSPAAACGSLTLVISEKQWPSNAQLEAVVSAMAQQRCAWMLRLHLREQVPGSISTAMWSRLVTSLDRFFGRLAAEAPKVTGLEVTSLVEADPSRLLQALAQLSSIQHLGCSIRPDQWEATADVMHLSALSSLTALTSLEVDNMRDTQQAPEAAVQQLMQLLAQLTRLQSIKLGLYLRGSVIRRAHLPALPNVRHLHLTATGYGPVLLLLSAQHCAQLESLSCHQFQPAAGVSSMEQLTQLEVMRMPRQEQQQQQQQQEQQQDEQQPLAPLLPLHFPRLQRAKLQSQHDLAFLEDLASRAPAIEELDLSQMFISNTARDQHLAQLLAQLPPLIHLAATDGDAHLPQDGASALSLWLPQQTRIQSLRVSHSVEQDQLPLLRACASLCDLSLVEQARTAVLHTLPPQLTALTLSCFAKGPSSGEVAGALLPPLQRLLLRADAAALQALPLGELAQLTSLRAPASNTSMPVGISRLTQLVELEAQPWPGMAQHLACLKGLRSLELWCDGETELQAGQLSVLTQLRELSVEGRGVSVQQQQQLSQQLSKALPHCIMRVGRR